MKIILFLSMTQTIEVLLVITQIQLIAILSILIYHLVKEHKHKQHKPDPLLRHFKEYIAEGLTFSEAKKKLEDIGFDKQRINKILQDFLKH
jgi:hypothetical protein